jgi:microcystin-dependent protein
MALQNITYSPGEPIQDMYDKINAAIDRINILEPIGSVIPYFGTVSPNPSLVLANGQAISRTTYSEYFSLVGEDYGVGDGSTTFNVPDLKGRFLVGYDPGDSDYDELNSTMIGGAKEVTLTAAQSGLPAHTHTQFGTTGANEGASGGGAANGTSNTGANTAQDASQAHENRPPYMTINYLIRVL